MGVLGSNYPRLSLLLNAPPFTVCFFVFLLCCRYISEDFGGVALHPVDIIDGSSGRLLAALVDGHLETITPVNLPHPRLDIIISGSSRWARGVGRGAWEVMLEGPPAGGWRMLVWEGLFDG